jgi:hypothetical protein
MRFNRVRTQRDVVMEPSLKLLWYVFSAAWIAYMIFVLLVSKGQKRIWQQIRDVRAQLQNIAKH